MQHRKIIVIGGISFVLAALAFVGVFSYLAANFNYPDILDGSAADVLPRLREGGPSMRAIWAIYAFLPLMLLPGAVASYFACPASRARMTLALVAAALGALSMCLGLMRWPSIHWVLAEAYLQAGAETKTGLAAVFHGLNVYLGNYIGEFLGETMLAVFFLLAGLSMRDEARFPAWAGWAGIAFACLFQVGAFRNVSGAVQFIADINNALLPLWLVVMGVLLVWYARDPQGKPAPQA
ncbi:MAG: DUF4386 family protein [Pseudomonadota bacterium]